jgi:hypothetical protein
MDNDPQAPKPTAPEKNSASLPSSAPQTPAAEAAAQDPHSPSQPKANAPAEKTGFKGQMDKLRRRLRTTWNFAKEAWDEHDLWIEALAVKGGASAIIIAGVVALTSVVALPFFAAAGVIAGCGALLGIGIYSCAAAGAKAWETATNVWARVRGREPVIKPKKERKDIIERLAEMKWVKKLSQSPLAQKVYATRAWKVTQKFTKRREDAILTGMAVGGAVVTLALGATVLATQVLVLPVVAVGSLLTWATAEVAVCFASGIYGMYLSGESILKKHREKKAAKEAALEKPLQLDKLAAPPPTAQPAQKPAEKPALSESFAEKAQANDNGTPATEKAPVAVPAAKKPPAPPSAA